MDVLGRRNGAENGQAANRRLARCIMLASLFHIAPLIDIPMFNIKYLATHKVHVHSGAKRKLKCGLCPCTRDNSLSQSAYLGILPLRRRFRNCPDSHFAQNISIMLIYGILVCCIDFCQFFAKLQCLVFCK